MGIKAVLGPSKKFALLLFIVATLLTAQVGVVLANEVPPLDETAAPAPLVEPVAPPAETSSEERIETMVTPLTEIPAAPVGENPIRTPRIEIPLPPVPPFVQDCAGKGGCALPPSPEALVQRPGQELPHPYQPPTLIVCDDQQGCLPVERSIFCDETKGSCFALAKPPLPPNPFVPLRLDNALLKNYPRVNQEIKSHAPRQLTGPIGKLVVMGE